MDSGKETEGTQTRPQIVEIVGPAGAGKTTLCEILSRHRGIRLGNFPDVRKVTSLPFFAWHGLRVLSNVMLTFPGGLKELGRRELAWLSILSGWPNVLHRVLKKTNDLILLDQGPVFLLSEMKLFGPSFLRSKRAMRLWQTWYGQWAAVLHVVVWLDAPDECLRQRIQNREKDHMVKDGSAQAVSTFLRDYRRVYKQTFSALAENRGTLKILRFDTSRQAPEEIADQLFTEFDLRTFPSADQR